MRQYAPRHLPSVARSRVVGLAAFSFTALLLSALILSSSASTPTPATAPDGWVAIEATVLAADEDPEQAWLSARLAPVHLVKASYTVGTATFTVNYGRVGSVERAERYVLFVNPSDYRQAVDSAGRTRVLLVRATGVLLLMLGAYGSVWVVRQRRAIRQAVSAQDVERASRPSEDAA